MEHIDVGNARQALDLLRVGAEVAEKAGDDCVTETHITEARTKVQRGRLENRIRDQIQHAQYILEAVAVLALDNKTPAKSKTIQAMYEQVAESWASEPLTTLKSVQDHLSDLQMLDFLHRYERNEGLNGGLYHEHELDLDPSTVIEIRKQIEDENM